MEQNTRVNVVSNMLIALLLLPKMRDTGSKYNVTPHLEIVTSEAHKVTAYEKSGVEDIYTKLADKTFYEKDGKSNPKRYSTSKLMQILFVRELVKSTKEVPVITLVTPGMKHSELTNRSPSRIEHIGAQVFKFLLARKTEVGGRTLVAGACAGSNAHGQYMEDGKAAEIDVLIPKEQLDAVQKKTYMQTLAYLETIEPSVTKNI